MGYTTYDFYQNTYFGDLLTQENFQKWESRASDEVDSYTRRRAAGTLETDLSERVQKAVCAVADTLFQIDQATATALDATSVGNIKTRSSGNESITYGSTETTISRAAKDPRERDSLIYSIIRKYLWDTGLLYANVKIAG